MSSIIMNCQRGTSSFYSNKKSHNRFKKKNQVTWFSKIREGMKISINRGTKSIHITKKPFLGIPHQQKIIVVNRGTKCLRT
jgi:hypothetical protein